MFFAGVKREANLSHSVEWLQVDLDRARFPAGPGAMWANPRSRLCGFLPQTVNLQAGCVAFCATLAMERGRLTKPYSFAVSQRFFAPLDHLRHLDYPMRPGEK